MKGKYSIWYKCELEGQSKAQLDQSATEVLERGKCAVKGKLTLEALVKYK